MINTHWKRNKMGQWNSRNWQCLFNLGVRESLWAGSIWAETWMIYKGAGPEGPGGRSPRQMEQTLYKPWSKNEASMVKEQS